MTPAPEGVRALRDFVAEELSRPAVPEAVSLAAELARVGGEATAAVLFYGSALRTGDLDGVLDFYLLIDRLRDWPTGRAVAVAGAWLAPNVEYREVEIGGRRLRAKVAILRPDQFARLARGDGLDTSVWARFAQPAALVWSRDADAREVAVDAVTQAVRAAGLWAARLGPETGAAGVFWDTLFRATYAADLRIEPKGRQRAILDAGGARWAKLLPMAWTAAGLAFTGPADQLRPALSQAERAQARRAWAARARAGKPLTVLRLAKAVFTFRGAADYAAWKIERHTGVKVEVTPWKRRFPLLAAPGLAWKLWRAGVLR